MNEIKPLFMMELCGPRFIKLSSHIQLFVRKMVPGK